MNEQSVPHAGRSLKRALRITQSGTSLLISGRLAESARPVALWAKRPHGEWVNLGKAVRKRRWFKLTPRNEFSCSVDLAARSGHLSCLLAPHRQDGPEPNVALFLEVECSQELLGADKATLSTTNPQRVRSKVRLGQFDSTDIGPLACVSVADDSRLPYVTNRGYLVIAINRKPKQVNDVKLRRLRLDNGYLRLDGTMKTRHRDIHSAHLVLVARRHEQPLRVKIHSTIDAEKTSHDYGLKHYSFSASFDLTRLFELSWSVDDVLSGWLETIAEGEQEPHRQRLPEASSRPRINDAQSVVTQGETSLIISHHTTAKSRSVSFRVDVFDAALCQSLWLGLERPSPNPSRSRRVWLIGEKPNTAQDTGLHFFRYVRRTRPEIEAYYVIEPGSNDAENLKDMGNVIPFRSQTHVDLFFEAECFIGSHHPDYLYPSRAPLVKRAASGHKVFLQHGVMGTKWMVPMYGSQAPNFETDLIIASSEREKQYVVHDFGYRPDQIAVTGLSRFDSLFADDVEIRRHQILIIPTWRDWLGNTDKFLQSRYFQAWQDFLLSQKLRALSLEYGLEVVFCLHPNMQKFRHHFVGGHHRIVAQEDIDVQFLLKQSGIMITDFSSVAFDFSFLHKPVLYYQFDRERFIGSWGSHIDLDNELPGPILFDSDSLMEELRFHLRNRGAMRQEFVHRAESFLSHRDQRNSERIFECVQASIMARQARPRDAI